MKHYYLFPGAVVILAFILSASKADVWSNVQNLRKKLLKDYDKKVSPHGGSNGTTVVHFDLIVKDIFVDEEMQIFTVKAFVLMLWNDSRLMWKPSDFEEEYTIYFENHELWKPDLVVINTAMDAVDIDHFGNTQLFVHPEGIVAWFPPAIMSSPCTLDLKFWPYDTQKCKITMWSGTYDGFQVDVQMFRNDSNIYFAKFASENHPWKILEAQKVRHTATMLDDSRDVFLFMDFDFTIKRNFQTFGAFVAVPAVAIPMFLMVQFILPVDHSKRLLVGFVCSLLVMMELLFLKFSLPKLGTSVPFVVSYFSECFIIVILSIVLSSILGRLTHPVNPLLDFPPPQTVKLVLTGPLANILFLGSHASKVGLSGKASDDVEALDGKHSNYSHEWLLVAKVVDRISFILILCIFIFSLFYYVAPIH